MGPQGLGAFFGEGQCTLLNWAPAFSLPFNRGRKAPNGDPGTACTGPAEPAGAGRVFNETGATATIFF